MRPALYYIYIYTYNMYTKSMKRRADDGCTIHTYIHIYIYTYIIYCTHCCTVYVGLAQAHPNHSYLWSVNTCTMMPGLYAAHTNHGSMGYITASLSSLISVLTLMFTLSDLQNVGCNSVYLRPGSDCPACARLMTTYRSCLRSIILVP